MSEGSPQADCLPAIEAAIRSAIGNAFTVENARPVSGGCINQAMVVEGGGQGYFAKLNRASAADMFDAEADGLAAIAATGTFRTPAVIAAGSDEDHAFLVLEHLALRPLQSAQDGERFAKTLAAMHAVQGEHFGWPRDNYIGSTPQHNAESDNWARFFALQRIAPQLALARSKGFDGELKRLGQRLIDRIPALFLDYRPRPSLLHGDLWHGNAAMTVDGQPAIYDPAVHRGDREADLAMSELFGGFPSSFYATYRRLGVLDIGYVARKPLYTLYHVLNHLNLFGRAYLGEAERLVKRLCHDLCAR
jgi:fructosamine-3-kinase